jgi:signal transduction histidine kinase
MLVEQPAEEELLTENPSPGNAATCTELSEAAEMASLSNVITNAVKHGGSARVALTTDDPLAVIIEVEDEGRGISQDEKDKVFEPFYRSAWTLSRNQPGMGLGLSIARSIVLSHGGAIDLEDRTPNGLRVRIALPRASIM